MQSHLGSTSLLWKCRRVGPGCEEAGGSTRCRYDYYWLGSVPMYKISDVQFLGSPKLPWDKTFIALRNEWRVRAKVMGAHTDLLVISMKNEFIFLAKQFVRVACRYYDEITIGILCMHLF